MTPAASTTLTVVGEGVDVSDVPTDSTNLALRAAALLASRAGVDDAEVSMTIQRGRPCSS